MASSDRNMYHVLTGLIKFVVVDDILLSVFNVLYHDVMNYTKNQ